MNGVMDVLENELGLDIPVAGLQKNDKHQTSELLYGASAEIVPLKRTVKHFIYYTAYKMRFIDLQLHSIDKHVKKQV